MKLDDFKFKKLVGRGSTGKVYKVKYQKSKSKHNVFAIKEVRLNARFDKVYSKDYLKEVEIMKQIQHPNIIKFYDAFISADLSQPYLSS